MHKATYDGFDIFYSDLPRHYHLPEDEGVCDRQIIADHAGLIDHQLLPNRLPIKRNLPARSEEKGSSSLISAISSKI